MDKAARIRARSKLLEQYENCELDGDYANYIMLHGDPSVRVICNGDTLTQAMEDGYLLDEFIDSLLVFG